MYFHDLMWRCSCNEKMVYDERTELDQIMSGYKWDYCFSKCLELDPENRPVRYENSFQKRKFEPYDIGAFDLMKD